MVVGSYARETVHGESACKRSTRGESLAWNHTFRRFLLCEGTDRAKPNH